MTDVAFYSHRLPYDASNDRGRGSDSDSDRDRERGRDRDRDSDTCSALNCRLFQLVHRLKEGRFCYNLSDIDNVQCI